MITASGAEGISLKNCRHVHIIEPYWHPVRIQQVIGRARRICSHQELPVEERNIKVFMYLMTFSEEQIKDDQLSPELMLKDKSSIDNKTVLTTDEYIFEKANLKEELNKNFILTMKEAAIDCNLHKSSSDEDSYTCFSYNNPNVNNFLYAPSIQSEEKDTVDDLNEENVTFAAKRVTIDGIFYAMTEDFKLYDYESYLNAKTNSSINPVYIGTIDKNTGKIINEQ